jgi:hypothetical protein
VIAPTEVCVGMTFGRLSVAERVGTSRSGDASWRCTCACGQTTTASAGNLRSGNTKSCGCLKRERQRTARLRHGDTSARKTTPEFRSWCALTQRCTDPNSAKYLRYGGRGIEIAPRWVGREGFANFLADMGRKPSSQHSIERKNRDGNYEPENCVWATIEEQANNRSNNRLVTHHGETHSVAEWARRLGMAYSRLAARLDRGWPLRLARDPSAGRRELMAHRGKLKAPRVHPIENLPTDAELLDFPRARRPM